MDHHRVRPTRAVGAWSVAAVVVAALAAATTLPSMASRAETPPPPLPTTRVETPAVALYGPFGVLDGTPVDGGAQDPAALRPLDTYGRGPSLVLQARDPSVLLTAWRVTASPVGGEPDPAGGGDRLDLVSGVSEAGIETLAFTGPPAGEWVLRAELATAPDAPATLAWRLAVPDRSLPPTDEPFPAPDVVLFGAGATVVAARGSTCYVGTCSEIGVEPPDRALPLIDIPRRDAPIILTLSDGSAMPALRVEARAAGAGGSVEILSGPLRADTDAVTLPPLPRSGTWRLEVQVTYDLERGTGTAAARVRVP